MTNPERDVTDLYYGWYMYEITYTVQRYAWYPHDWPFGTKTFVWHCWTTETNAEVIRRWLDDFDREVRGRRYAKITCKHVPRRF